MSTTYTRGFRDGPFPNSRSLLTKGEPVMTRNQPTSTTWEPTVLYLVGLIGAEVLALIAFRYFLGKV